MPLWSTPSNAYGLFSRTWEMQFPVSSCAVYSVRPLCFADSGEVVASFAAVATLGCHAGWQHRQDGP